MHRFAALTALVAASAWAWGVRGHRELNRAAIETLEEPGLQFLLGHKEYVAYLSIVPDSYRTFPDPFLKIFEDPNHGWFLEQAPELMSHPPRSRYEFAIELHKLYQKTQDKLTNIRWTGTMPYAAVEHYERLKAAMRRLRQARAQKEDTRFVEQEIATYAGLLGHYTADGSQPLHISIHHDGWQGDNPKDYTRDPRIHGRMESQFVDLIEVKASDLVPRIGKAVVYDDAFDAIVQHYLKAGALTEKVYQIEKANGWADRNNEDAKALVHAQLAGGAELLRNLIHTAWAKSGEPMRRSARGANDPRMTQNPISPQNPLYNPETGSAPAGK
ncbi:MAG: hypothetical protein U0Q16_06285 [Bryobacteraceae bacterium]